MRYRSTIVRGFDVGLIDRSISIRDHDVRTYYYTARAVSRGARIEASIEALGIPDSAEQAETRQPKVKDRGHHVWREGSHFLSIFNTSEDNVFIQKRQEMNSKSK